MVLLKQCFSKFREFFLIDYFDKYGFDKIDVETIFIFFLRCSNGNLYYFFCKFMTLYNTYRTSASTGNAMDTYFYMEKNMGILFFYK